MSGEEILYVTQSIKNTKQLTNNQDILKLPIFTKTETKRILDLWWDFNKFIIVLLVNWKKIIWY